MIEINDINGSDAKREPQNPNLLVASVIASTIKTLSAIFTRYGMIPFCRTSPISYTCLLLAPEPAQAGEVPEVRLGAQVLAESVCSTYPCGLGFCSSKLIRFRLSLVEFDCISNILREVDRLYSRHSWLTNRADSCQDFRYDNPESLSALPSSTLFSNSTRSSNRVSYVLGDSILNVNRCATCIMLLREQVMYLYR